MVLCDVSVWTFWPINFIQILNRNGRKRRECGRLADRGEWVRVWQTESEMNIVWAIVRKKKTDTLKKWQKCSKSELFVHAASVQHSEMCAVCPHSTKEKKLIFACSLSAACAGKRRNSFRSGTRCGKLSSINTPAHSAETNTNWRMALLWLSMTMPPPLPPPPPLAAAAAAVQWAQCKPWDRGMAWCNCHYICQCFLHLFVFVAIRVQFLQMIYAT